VYTRCGRGYATRVELNEAGTVRPVCPISRQRAHPTLPARWRPHRGVSWIALLALSAAGPQIPSSRARVEASKRPYSWTCRSVTIVGDEHAD
jgi:hypothetical protein